MRTWQRGTTVLLALILAAAEAESIASLTDAKSHIPPDYHTFTPPTAVGESYVDPVFGETVVRGTDALSKGQDFYSAEYASSTLTNADESLVRIIDNGGAQNLFSLPDFGHFRRLNIGSSSMSDFWWDPTDPNLLYSVPMNRLDVYDASKDQSTVVHVFPGFGGVSGMGESNLSHDGNRLALKGRNPVTGPEQLLIYEFSSNSVIATLDVSDVPGFFDGSIAPSGNQVVIHTFPQPGGGGYAEVWDIDGESGTITKNFVFPRGTGHNDLARGPDGRDYLIMGESWFENTLYRYDLQDGTRLKLLHLGWSPLTLDSWMSTNSMHLDGWIYVSTSIYKGLDPDPDVKWAPYAAEIFRIRWDGSVIERLAHNRTVNSGYWNTPRASVSQSGRYLFWSSNYRNLGSPSAGANYADVYYMNLGQLTTAPPASPSSLRAEAQALGSTLELAGGNNSRFLKPQWAMIALSWEDNSHNEDSFQLFRREGPQSGFEQIASLRPNQTAFKDVVEGGRQHCYRVFARAASGRSVSNEACLNLDG